MKESFYFLFGLGFVLAAGLVVWFSTMKLPDFNDFENRKIANSTKIYDRTGKIVLYNIHDNIRRTQVKSEEISPYIKKATIAIEDASFYEHHGIRPTSLIRAFIASVQEGRYAQGGSTIDQQVVKNALLTQEKSIIRKIKEIVLAIKLDAQVDKETILNIYLNESPYGGNIYGVEEASLAYYGKHAKDVTLAEAAYLAAMPQAPSRYSPFKEDRTALENRKNLVLQKMYENNLITKEEYESTINQTVTFLKKEDSSGRAYHFVFYVRDYLEKKYGEDMVENGGLKVITTLDWDLQQNAEKIIYDYVVTNEKKFGAKNSAAVATDPRTGQILMMVGSRDYFDDKIDGKFNVATAPRQPGSSFKPFIYLESYMKGYSPDTMIFDVPTNFSTNCDAYGTSLNGKDCYMPVNYDGNFAGAVSFRQALLWSLNIPAVKVQYLVGVKNTLEFVKKFGLDMGNPSRYGLSLALGAGDVSLLNLTNAYGVFANNGIYHTPTGILEVTDKDGNTLEKFEDKPQYVVDRKYTDMLNDVLSDSKSRYPAYSVSNPINYYDRQVAVKTGTTNDFKDVWVIGYTPSIAVGMWGGNNDNTPVTKVAGTILSPVWRKVMDYALKSVPVESFNKPDFASMEYIKGDTCFGGNFNSILNYTSGPSDSQYNLWNIPIQSRLGGYCMPDTGVTGEHGSSTPEHPNDPGVPAIDPGIPTTVHSPITIPIVTPAVQ